MAQNLVGEPDEKAHVFTVVWKLEAGGTFFWLEDRYEASLSFQ
jgi:hypothetical protein